jgi:hypothetical protein
MLERFEPVLKVLCVALAAVLLFQIGRLVIRSNPLAHLNIPALPSLPPDTNAPTSVAPTNAVANRRSATNSANLTTKVGTSATNAPSAQKSGNRATNLLHVVSTNIETNLPLALAAAKIGTNSSSKPRSDARRTNTVARAGSAGTNAAVATLAGPEKRGTTGVPGMPPGMAAGMGPLGPQGIPKAAELPLPTLARVDRITDSEILGPVIRPLPTALLGIAGDVAFVRSASGQTGLVKEGDSLGELKLLRIGTNRVLVEEEGQKKELTIFSGYGGESLLTKQKENSQ